MTPVFIPYDSYQEYPIQEMQQRSSEFLIEMKRRRSVRDFSNRPVDPSIIEDCLKTANTSPSGANLQPWHFVVVSNPEVKKQIRIFAEHEEHEFYTKRATPEWLETLIPLGTDETKPFLEKAPYLIVIFVKSYELKPDGTRVKYYYSHESTGIATGLLISAIHHAGLACLTHTPSPMGFLNKILNRPINEKPFLLLVVGYPEEGARIPKIKKKELFEVCSFI
jgi:iodotyrosine deiodinase